jgi:hypothetical protein
MRKQVVIVCYWLGSFCAVLGLIARGLDAFGMNFIDFATKGGGIGYHSLMDGTLFFYMISIGSASFERYLARHAEIAPAAAGKTVRSSVHARISSNAEQVYSGAEM